MQTINSAPEVLRALKAEVALTRQNHITGTAFIQECARVHAAAEKAIAKAERT